MYEFLLFVLAFSCIVLCKTKLIEAVHLSLVPDNYKGMEIENEAEVNTINTLILNPLESCNYNTGIVSSSNLMWKTTTIYVQYRVLATFKKEIENGQSNDLYYRILKRTCDLLELSYFVSKTKCVTLVIEKRDTYKQKATDQGGILGLPFYEKDWIWAILGKKQCKVTKETADQFSVEPKE
ncbi:uncharacterized protein LOC128983276 [Macrosteles quadrilineatus]|uniref:uncharacterized protein LOC128983276 n=1 Tax=Macrosteles quadrilineatus TaxID=74068 RepID=UPI0023E319AC|nr:uncharacterized protein LOC128983276 [Macrosteles quadrilineatus]